VDAQFSLGTMYRTGEGISEDDAKAVHWHTKVAKLGT
jgi:TPR repeat protein